MALSANQTEAERVANKRPRLHKNEKAPQTFYNEKLSQFFYLDFCSFLLSYTEIHGPKPIGLGPDQKQEHFENLGPNRPGGPWFPDPITSPFSATEYP